jgi:ABC-type nitrate/sulfonate/bicarbonate transport system permease component
LPPVRLYARYESAILKLTGIVLALGAWQLAVSAGITDPMVVSSPYRIAVAGSAYLASQQFAVDAATSGSEFLGGFGLALILGIVTGFATGCSKRIEYLLDPLLNFLYASPRVALTPLLIIWFGIGIPSKVAIIFLMSVFPIIINTAQGVRSVDRDLSDLARSLNASPLQLLWTIIVPSSIPFIVTGIRIALGVAMIGVVVGEFVASTSGIGFTIQQAASSYQVDQVFVGLIIIGAAGAVLTEALRYVELRLAAWKVVA